MINRMTISTVHADRSTVWRLVLFISLVWWFALPNAAAQVKRGADRKGLIVLDPAHPHGAQIQHALKPAFREDVYVYAPFRNDLAASYSNLINRFNKSDTSGRPWRLHTHVGDDYLERMLQDRKGEMVLIASNNQQKADYILKTAEAGLDVIADKPMALTSADFSKLQAAFAAAERQKRFISDLPAMSMRNQVTCILQKELAAVGEIFGALEKGSPDHPAVVQENLHYYYKRIQRPTWFFDVKQQGNGVRDVTTHLADLVLWTCFPDQQSDYEKDIRVVSAKLWPTMITPAQFKKATRADTYPGFLTPYLKDSVLMFLRFLQLVGHILHTFDRAPAEGGSSVCKIDPMVRSQSGHSWLDPACFSRLGVSVAVPENEYFLFSGSGTTGRPGGC